MGENWNSKSSVVFWAVVVASAVPVEADGSAGRMLPRVLDAISMTSGLGSFGVSFLPKIPKSPPRDLGLAAWTGCAARTPAGAFGLTTPAGAFGLIAPGHVGNGRGGVGGFVVCHAFHELSIHHHRIRQRVPEPVGLQESSFSASAFRCHRAGFRYRRWEQALLWSWIWLAAAAASNPSNSALTHGSPRDRAWLERH